VVNPIHTVVRIKVEQALPLTSPAYDLGLTEDEVRSRWQRYWALLGGQDEVQTGE